jgi:hypothetical protein
MAAQSKWQLSGDYFENCNCDVVCPCLVSAAAPLTARPSQGSCDVALVFHIDRGLFPLGIMNISAMAMITLVVFAEKTLPWGGLIARGTAAVLVAYGAAVIVAPRALPTFLERGGMVTPMPGAPKDMQSMPIPGSANPTSGQ